jgi:hypothetical protein
MKIFVSYSRRDAGDFAEQIQSLFAGFEHYEHYEVFTDVNSIKARDMWSDTIEDNISSCDIFVVIVTNGALQSPHVETEILQAQKEKKRIIPCFHRSVRNNNIKWALNKIQGVEFEDKFELARNLYSKIASQNEIKALAPMPKLEPPAPPRHARPKFGGRFGGLFRKKSDDGFIGGRKSMEEAESDPVPQGKYQEKGAAEEDNEEVLERYPYARFPSRIILGDTAPLEILIKTTQMSQSTPRFEIKPKNGEDEVPISVIIDPGTFEIQGGADNYYTTIHVPVKLEDSIPVTFFLKAKVEGPQKIQIRFHQGPTYLGKLTIDTLVVASQDELGSDTQFQMISEGWRFPRNIQPGPDITLYINEVKVTEGEVKYDVLLFSAELPMKRLGPIPYKGNPGARFLGLFKDIENQNLPANVIENRMAANGRMLYDEIFPKDLKDLYWEKQEKIKSIRVISLDPWIPWEIIKPHHETADGDDIEDPYLCEAYSFSRWIVDVPEAFQEEPLIKQINKVTLVAPTKTDLQEIEQESNWLDNFTKKAGVGMVKISTYEEVIHLIRNGGFDLLHFSTHGFYNEKENPLFSVLKLDENKEIRPNEIYGKFRKSKPFVLLNACQTGMQGFSFTKVGGWAQKFITEDPPSQFVSSVFIGTLWSVSDEAAAKFSTELYDQLSKGVALGEAVRNARNSCKKYGDPSWLAYQLYGHPNLQVKFG